MVVGVGDVRGTRVVRRWELTERADGSLVVSDDNGRRLGGVMPFRDEEAPPVPLERWVGWAVAGGVSARDRDQLGFGGYDRLDVLAVVLRYLGISGQRPPAVRS